MKPVAVIAGAGFSAESAVPLTSEIGPLFLQTPTNSSTPPILQKWITQQLRKYWGRTFGFAGKKPIPSFEDHFTLLDLAANAGHNLGRSYSPAALRAIRRLSIHRVFEILDRYHPNEKVEGFLRLLSRLSDNTLISTNWDISAEAYLPDLCHYGGDILQHGGDHTGRAPGLMILKLHGSSNWLYCDLCQTTVHGRAEHGKAAVRRAAFLETRDLALLSAERSVRAAVKQAQGVRLHCEQCDIPLTARVATFSYSKAFDFVQFQRTWSLALQRLRLAERWIFIGYSLPEADFHLRHLLKRAQLSRPRIPEIVVVVKGHKDADRFSQFFGSAISQVEHRGFSAWWTQRQRTEFIKK